MIKVKSVMVKINLLYLVVLWFAYVSGNSNVTIIQRRVPFEALQTLTLENNIEYLLDFTPDINQSNPPRLWVSTIGGDILQPILITVRQMTGATTWQLPYMEGDILVEEFERSICFPDSSDLNNHDECDQPTLTGSFTVHVASVCGSKQLRVRASAATDYRLVLASENKLLVTIISPSVRSYRFAEGQDAVRLVVSSDDDVCATVSVQNYTCPIPQSLSELSQSGLRMTVLYSGGVHLSRNQYPVGFLVVVVIHANDEICTGEKEVDNIGGDWLWDAAVLGREESVEVEPPREKTLQVIVQSALSRDQYAVASAAILVFFLLFYIAFMCVLLLEKWPPFYKYVAPKAVLAVPIQIENGSQTQTDGTRRRDSTATFDSSDVSDSDSEEEAKASTLASDARGVTFVDNAEVTSDGNAHDSGREGVSSGDHVANGRNISQSNGVAATVPSSSVDGNVVQSTGGRFGLPAQLTLAALARRRAKVTRARSARYLHTLFIVAVFYALPVLQFVAGFQVVLNVSGTLDICYYNFLCAHPLGALSDFNHVFSNFGYLLLGLLFVLQLRVRRNRRKKQPKDEEYGIPAHYELMAALGCGMVVVALLSSAYHVCPNRLNFQFDTAFMYVLGALTCVKMYQARHPDVNARAHATFAALAVLMALVVWGVLGGGALFWGVITVLHIFTILLLSLRIYYVGQFKIDKTTVSLSAISSSLSSRPMYLARLIALLVANAVNWSFALYGLFTMRTDFASHLLEVILGNALFYLIFYIVMKTVQGERMRWYAWCWVAGAALSWAPGLYFFMSGSSDWAATPAMSRHKNHECLVLQFYDAHDLWHLLSAIALYCTFNVLLTWDDGLSAVKRTEITVF